MWENGRIGNYIYCLMRFNEPSHYGINNGKISKLFIRRLNKWGHQIVNYDRGWDKKPRSKAVKAVYDELIAKWN
jgi:hypothetical protein